MKFIVLLRDPVQRAMSSYWFKNSEKFQGEDRGGHVFIYVCLCVCLSVACLCVSVSLYVCVCSFLMCV